MACFILYSSVLASDLDKRNNKDWNTKKQDLFTLCQAVYDITYKFDDEDKLTQYLSSIGVEKGSSTLVSHEIIKKVMSNLQPIAQQPGGSASNTAVGLASFNFKAATQIIIADDEIGKLYEDGIKKYGVETITKTMKAGEGSGVVIVIVAPDGERTMLAYPGVSKKISKKDIYRDIIKDYKIVLSEGYLWDVKKENNEAIRDLFRVAHEEGAITAFTFGSHGVVKKYRTEWLELLKSVDIVFSDQQQIYQLFQTTDWKKIKNAVKAYDAIFIVTFAKDGAFILKGDQEIYIPAHDVEKVVDTTGAGDQFAAGFLYGYIKGWDLKRSGELGALIAAAIIQQIGAKPDVPFSESLGGMVE